MAPKFGTSGLRGLVTELTDDLVAAYVRAFLTACCSSTELWIGRDLRPSSAPIAVVVAAEAVALGRRVVDCGALPTPALALAAAGQGGIMVTGSHIPADRNGLKFFTAAGEITKDEEADITAALGASTSSVPEGNLRHDAGAAARFVDRYVKAFGAGALSGRRIGLYAHSAVGRDLLANCLGRLGADVVVFARTDSFVPVDTEAVDPQTRAMLTALAQEHRLDAIASTDGDSDRPMLADETGRVIPGDLLGQMTAELLGATTVVTPISSNSGVLQKGFDRVVRTRIGSPYVIAAMNEAGGKVVGYEANGGTILGFAAMGPAGLLPPLMTRDGFLPVLAPLIAAGTGRLSDRVAREPPRYTAADRLQNIEPELSREFLASLTGKTRSDFLAFEGAAVIDEDRTDGLRLTLADGGVIHMRPSGNAPEVRLYVEAETPQRAEDLLACGLAALRERLDPQSR